MLKNKIPYKTKTVVFNIKSSYSSKYPRICRPLCKRDVSFFLYLINIQGRAFKVLQAIIFENMRQIKNMFRQKLCDIEANIKWYHRTGPGDLKKWPKFKMLTDLRETWYSKIFWVTDFESDVKSKKLKMADLIWQL